MPAKNRSTSSKVARYFVNHWRLSTTSTSTSAASRAAKHSEPISTNRTSRYLPRTKRPAVGAPPAHADTGREPGQRGTRGEQREVRQPHREGDRNALRLDQPVRELEQRN